MLTVLPDFAFLTQTEGLTSSFDDPDGSYFEPV